MEELNRAIAKHSKLIDYIRKSPAGFWYDPQTSWEDVLKKAELVADQASEVVEIFAEETPAHNVLEGNMNELVKRMRELTIDSRNFLLSTGAGTTLSICITAKTENIVDRSFDLLKRAVSSLGSFGTETSKHLTPDYVWDAYEVLNEAPSRNIDAILSKMRHLSSDVCYIGNDMVSSMPGDQVTEGSSEEVDSYPIGGGEDEGDGRLCFYDWKMSLMGSCGRIMLNISALFDELIKCIGRPVRIPVDSLENMMSKCLYIQNEFIVLKTWLKPPQDGVCVWDIMQKVHDWCVDIEQELLKNGAASQAFLDCSQLVKDSITGLKNKKESSQGSS